VLGCENSYGALLRLPGMWGFVPGAPCGGGVVLMAGVRALDLSTCFVLERVGLACGSSLLITLYILGNACQVAKLLGRKVLATMLWGCLPFVVG